jgi:hypothetical protein
MIAKDTKNLADDARKLAAILIRLHQDYPMFLKDVTPDDPDLDMDIGFKTYDELERLANGRRLNKIQQRWREIEGHSQKTDGRRERTNL